MNLLKILKTLQFLSKRGTDVETAKKAKNDLDFLVNLAIIVAVNQDKPIGNVINNKHFPVKKDFVKNVVVTLPIRQSNCRRRL